MTTNSKSLIVDKLSLLASLYKQDPELIFKYNAIRKAIDSINKYDAAIISGKQAKKDIPNIGTGIARRIDEILDTQTLAELKNYEKDVEGIKESKDIEELKRITGIGEVRAKALVKKGITMVDQYRKAVKDGKENTTLHIDIGLKYFEDFERKIPRKEVEEMEKLLRVELKKVDKNLTLCICGSYRRGKKYTGDIDVLITYKKGKDNHYLAKYIERLEKIGFLKDHLTWRGEKKYMGVARLKNHKYNRRIDIRYIDYPSYYAAIVYFTGSKNFNIKLRREALKLGYSLNEYGLTDKKTREIIMFHSEEEVFKLLGMDYVEPEDRDI